MSDAHRNYLFDLGYELKQDALAARRDRDSAPCGTEERAFNSGRLLAFYEIISMMRNRAEGFDIPLSDLRLDDIEPDRDLTWSPAREKSKASAHGECSSMCLGGDQGRKQNADAEPD